MRSCEVFGLFSDLETVSASGSKCQDAGLWGLGLTGGARKTKAMIGNDSNRSNPAHLSFVFTGNLR